VQFDLIIENGLVVDGTGTPGTLNSVGITGTTISAIGDLSAADAPRRIDATGHVVSPGFIDTHAHSDGALLIDGQHAEGVRQGITTEIIGPDGLTYAPLPREKYLMYRQYLSGLLGLPPEDLDMSSISSALNNYHHKTAPNVAMFLGHGPIRLGAVGMEDVPLRDEALKVAIRTMEEAFEQGACGFATGLSYYPNSFSDSEELVELCKVAARHGKAFSIHTRNHNVDRAFHGGGVEEALEIGRRSGVKVHIEHYRTSAGNAGQIDEIMEPIERAKNDGVDVTLELYPYPVGSGHPLAHFPSWFHEGGTDAALKRLADEETKAMLIKELELRDSAVLHSYSWTWISSEANRHYEGMSFADVATERGTSIEQMICEVMLEERFSCGLRGIPPSSARLWRAVEEDVMSLLDRPDYMVGSDAIPVGGIQHPRAWGTFPRIIGRLRRRHGYPVEQLVQRLAQNPARRFGLAWRGEIREGFRADICVFDPDMIIDIASFEDPMMHPIGIPHVLVNGQLVVENSECTGIMSGEGIKAI
jgi:N-acyl-D-amino-acid deacylase